MRVKSSWYEKVKNVLYVNAITISSYRFFIFIKNDMWKMED